MAWFVCNGCGFQGNGSDFKITLAEYDGGDDDGDEDGDEDERECIECGSTSVGEA